MANYISLLSHMLYYMEYFPTFTKFEANVGKYSSPMEYLGYRFNSFPFRPMGIRHRGFLGFTLLPLLTTGIREQLVPL